MNGTFRRASRLCESIPGVPLRRPHATIVASIHQDVRDSALRRRAAITAVRRPLQTRSVSSSYRLHHGHDLHREWMAGAHLRRCGRRKPVAILESPRSRSQARPRVVAFTGSRHSHHIMLRGFRLSHRPRKCSGTLRYPQSQIGSPVDCARLAVQGLAISTPSDRALFRTRSSNRHSRQS